MAKDKPEEKAEAAKAPEAAPAADQAPAAAGAQQQRVQVPVDDSQASTSYSNFCRVTGTPEELIVDFGLNSQPFGAPTSPIKITQRLVINFFTAKRLLSALSMSVQRHEQAFGVLETDVQKRVQPGVAAQRPPAANP